MDEPKSQPTHFINVDLDLRDDQPLDGFIEHWGDRIFTLHHTGSADKGWSAGFELSQAGRNAEAAILAFVAAVRSLPDELRTRWDNLSERTLDVGVQAGSHPRSWRFVLEAATVAALHEIGATLACTVYPQSEGTSTVLPKQS